VRAFACPVCERLVTFESTQCLHCGTTLGYDPEARSVVALAEDPPAAALLRCANARVAACNWLVELEGSLCRSCALTRTRPDERDADGLRGFADAEAAKRRLLFELAELGLPTVSFREREGGLAFDLLSSANEHVTTGHADGVITLDLDETYAPHRERMRVQLGEPYRTVLGHLRHEIGHYYQPILMPPGSPAEARCRGLFGDERENYREAMERHYRDGAPAAWEQEYVSAYATMHPWEDWAETFAHYLHICDTLQTAAAYGVSVAGPTIATADAATLHSRPEGEAADVHAMLEAWLPMTYALNAISRSMGAPDLYPFVLAPRVEAKLGLVDELVRGRSGRGAAAGVPF
jgi:hypothetical protein